MRRLLCRLTFFLIFQPHLLLLCMIATATTKATPCTRIHAPSLTSSLQHCGFYSSSLGSPSRKCVHHFDVRVAQTPSLLIILLFQNVVIISFQVFMIFVKEVEKLSHEQAVYKIFCYVINSTDGQYTIALTP